MHHNMYQAREVSFIYKNKNLKINFISEHKLSRSLPRIGNTRSRHRCETSPCFRCCERFHSYCLYITAALRIGSVRILSLRGKQRCNAMQSSACWIWIKAWCADTYPPDIPILQLGVLHLRAPTLSPFPLYWRACTRVRIHVCVRVHLSASTGESKVRLTVGLTNCRQHRASALQEAMIFAWKLSCVRLPLFWVKIWIMHRVPLHRNIWLCMRLEKKRKLRISFVPRKYCLRCIARCTSRPRMYVYTKACI